MSENLDYDFKNEQDSMSQFILKLSGRSFNNGISINSTKRIYKRRIQEIYAVNIDLEINPDFLYCDLKDKIELLKKNDNKKFFTGVITETLVEGKKAKLIAEDFFAIFNHTQIKGFEVSPYLDPSDIISILITPFIYDGIRLGKVPGVPNTSPRDFIVIVPVKNLIFKENFTIGNVEFYNKFNTLDDKIIGKMHIVRDIIDWKSNPARARIVINASEFKTALFEGYSKVSNAIDLIALRNDFSFPKLNINGEDKYFNFHYDDLAANVSIPAWVYCREDETDLYAIYNIEVSRDNALDYEHNFDKYFEPINQLFSELICKESLTQNDKRLLMALHWLRRAIQDTDNIDKLLDLWTAMEFLIYETKVPPLFSKDQTTLIKQVLSSNLELTNDQEKALQDKIDMLNSPPLMIRIDALIKKTKIDLTNEEKDLLSNARKKRNNIIHGKRDIVVFNKELDKLKSIIERLLIGKMNYLEHGD